MCDRLMDYPLQTFSYCGVEIVDIKYALHQFAIAVEYECCGVCSYVLLL